MGFSENELDLAGVVLVLNLQILDLVFIMELFLFNVLHLFERYLAFDVVLRNAHHDHGRVVVDLGYDTSAVHNRVVF